MYWWFDGLVTKSCPTLGTPWTVACQAPLSMGFPKARILEWVANFFSRGSSQTREQTQVSCIDRWILQRLSHLCSAGLCLGSQSCPILCDPMDCSLPVNSVLGDSPGSCWSGLLCSPPGDLPNPGIKPRSSTLQVDSLPAALPGKPSHLLHRSYLSYNLRNTHTHTHTHTTSQTALSQLNPCHCQETTNSFDIYDIKN